VALAFKTSTLSIVRVVAQLWPAEPASHTHR
jgi:hypothetical protein